MRYTPNAICWLYAIRYTLAFVMLLSLLWADVALPAATVGTTTDADGTFYPFQRKSFYANGRYWLFYSNAYNILWAHSTDGSTWTSTTRTSSTASPSSNSGSWTNPANAYDDDTDYAWKNSAGTPTHTYSGFGYSVPGTAEILSVKVIAHAYVSGDATNPDSLGVEVYDGSTWYARDDQVLPTSEGTKTFDVTSKTTWTPTMINNLQVRLSAVQNGGTAGNVAVCWLSVTVVYYDPSGLRVRDEATSATVNGYDVSVWFDGTYVHYVYGAANLYYRRGTPNSDGTITWSAAEQTVITGAGTAGAPYCYYPTISVDSDGYPWIGFMGIVSSSYYPYVVKASTTDGTWTTDTGFPSNLYSTTGDSSSTVWTAFIVPLNSSKVYALFGVTKASRVLYGRLWESSAWSPALGSAPDGASSNYVAYANGYSAIGEGDTIHLAYLEATSYHLHYQKYTYGSGWAAPEDIYTGAGTNSSAWPTLSLEQQTGYLYCFYAGVPTDDHIYYKQRTTSWQAAQDWVNETSDTLTYHYALTSFYMNGGNQIGVAYLTKASSPYNVMFSVYSVTAITLASFTASAASDGVKVEWVTKSEIDNLGFNLYRRVDGREEEQLNEKLIPGLLSSISGQKYTYRDTGVQAGIPICYTLEDIDLSGKKTRHGPACVYAPATQDAAQVSTGTKVEVESGDTAGQDRGQDTATGTGGGTGTTTTAVTDHRSPITDHAEPVSGQPSAVGGSSSSLDTRPPTLVTRSPSPVWCCSPSVLKPMGKQ